MSNPHRGDVEITLDGRTFVMRPTFEAMVEAERATGHGMVELMMRSLSGTLGIGETVAIVVAGMKAAGLPATVEKIGPKVFETGIMKVRPAVNDFLANALNGGETPGEAEAADRMSSLTEDSPPSPSQT